MPEGGQGNKLKEYRITGFKSNLRCVIFQVLTAASMVFKVFWDVAPCSHVEVDRRFRGGYCLHHQGGGSTHL
jgi:hypothetical protein